MRDRVTAVTPQWRRTSYDYRVNRERTAMADITFTIETEVQDVRLELEEDNRFIPIDLNNNVGNATFASGYEGVVHLVLQGQRGQTAKLRITQRVGSLDTVLNELTDIEITDDSGEATCPAAFRVR